MLTTVADYTGLYDIGLPGTVIPRGYALIVDRDYVGTYNAYMEENRDIVA